MTCSTRTGLIAIALSFPPGTVRCLLYSLLHLSGYEGMPRGRAEAVPPVGQQDARPPGTWPPPGIETTTGPLGQGISNAVGMALAERMLAERFNRPDFEIVDHYTYVIASDGDLMEGISHEACSLAGHLGPGQADRLLRRQLDQYRRLHGDRFHGRCTEAI